jgi:hypothetical protein
MMVGNDHSPWELLQDYDSDEGDNSMASISDDEEPPALPPTSNASGSDKPPSKAEYKLALKTVLKALDYDDEEVERHSKKKPGKEVKLRPGELLQALPHMDKAEKRELYKALKAEQETIAEETVQQAPPTSDKLKRANQRAGGYRATASSSSAPAAPTAAAPQEPQKDVPAAVRKKQLATFRRTLFENSLSRRGHVKPSQASEYPTAEQEACPHSFDDLRWGANNSAHWAHCKRCKLKRVLYYSMDHGAMMVGEDLQEVYNMGPSLSPGEVIVDTGCRTSVAGCAWHKMHQAAIRTEDWVSSSLKLAKRRPFVLELVHPSSAGRLTCTHASRMANLLGFGFPRWTALQHPALASLAPVKWPGGAWSCTSATVPWLSLESSDPCA